MFSKPKDNPVYPKVEEPPAPPPPPSRATAASDLTKDGTDKTASGVKSLVNTTGIGLTRKAETKKRSLIGGA